MLLSNACLCVKTFGIAETYLELIYVPTNSALVREWEHASVFLMTDIRKETGKKHFEVQPERRIQQSASPPGRGHRHFPPLILTCTSFAWSLGPSEMRVFSISYRPNSPSQDLVLTPRDPSVRSDLTASLALISQWEPYVRGLLWIGVWLSPPTDPTQDMSYNFIPFLKTAFK